MTEKTYIAIDLKSFYASVECKERGLDPMTTNLVVADDSRTAKTICLAVSPTLKSYGISGRPRLFEVEEKVGVVNAQRQKLAPKGRFLGTSYDFKELERDASLKLTYITAVPRMALYLDYSAKIYGVYLKYIAAEDIHVYSIDEVFIDATAYLNTYKMSARQLAGTIIRDVLKTTGITATAGIGTNLYLCKVAMDIVAKHISADEDGVRIAELDEMNYRKLLWNHTPLTDFWRVGRGYAKKLNQIGLHTMGDIARCSLGKTDDFYNEDLLYRLFGINAELLIDHAWGWEPCTMADIKAYKPSTNSVGSGQVLHTAYSFDKARLVVHEMLDSLVLELVDKGLVCDKIVLTVGYDKENLSDPKLRGNYKGEIIYDGYGRQVPKPAHGTVSLGKHTSSAKLITQKVLKAYDEIVDKNLLVRRINLSANNVIDEKLKRNKERYEQLDLFTDYDELSKEWQKEEIELKKEKSIQEAIIGIKKKYGKNAVLKGMSLQEGATAAERNNQIGGHKA